MINKYMLWTKFWVTQKEKPVSKLTWILQGLEAKSNLARSSVLSIFPSPVYIHAELPINCSRR